MRYKTVVGGELRGEYSSRVEVAIEMEKKTDEKEMEKFEVMLMSIY